MLVVCLLVVHLLIMLLLLLFLLLFLLFLFLLFFGGGGPPPGGGGGGPDFAPIGGGGAIDSGGGGVNNVDVLDGSGVGGNTIVRKPPKVESLPKCEGISDNLELLNVSLGPVINFLESTSGAIMDGVKSLYDLLSLSNILVIIWFKNDVSPDT